MDFCRLSALLDVVKRILVLLMVGRIQFLVFRSILQSVGTPEVQRERRKRAVDRCLQPIRAPRLRCSPAWPPAGLIPNRSASQTVAGNLSLVLPHFWVPSKTSSRRRFPGSTKMMTISRMPMGRGDGLDRVMTLESR